MHTAVKEREKVGEQAVKPQEPGRRARVVRPRVDIYETKDAHVVLVEMPGVDENSVDVKIEKDWIGVHGKPDRTLPEGYRSIHRECETGDYKRTFTFYSDIDRDRISAFIKDGLLKLVLPKSEKALTKRIVVKSE